MHLCRVDIIMKHDNLEEYRDPINYDLEFGGKTDKYNFLS